MAAHDPATRRMISSMGGDGRWAHVADRTAATEPMRAGFLASIERKVRQEHPHATDQQVAAMVESRRRLHYKRMAIKSREVRRLKRELAELADGEVA